jgi:hypothetical protein
MMLFGWQARNPMPSSKFIRHRTGLLPLLHVAGEARSGLAYGFASIWVPLCGKKPELVRINAAKNRISARLPIAPAGPESGITASDDRLDGD